MFFLSLHFNKLKLYCVFASSTITVHAQDWPATLPDKSQMDMGGKRVRRWHRCADDKAKENVGKKSNFLDSIQKHIGWEILLIDFDDCSMLFLGDSITKRLQVGKKSLNCFTKGSSGWTIDELWRKIRQAKPYVPKLVVDCTGTNDVLSVKKTLKEVSDCYSELLEEIQQTLAPEKLCVCTLPTLEALAEHFNSSINNSNLDLRWLMNKTPSGEKIEAINLIGSMTGQ